MLTREALRVKLPEWLAKNRRCATELIAPAFEVEHTPGSIVVRGIRLPRSQIQIETGILGREAVPPPPICGLWRHQLAGYEWAYHHSAYLAIPMGGGKTLVAIAIMMSRQYSRVIVHCPKAVIPVWSREIKKHCPSGYRPRVLDLVGPVKQRIARAKQALELALLRAEPVIVVSNYEAAVSQSWRDFAVSQSWDLSICDEAHKIKSPGGKISRFFARWTKSHPHIHRIGLSGTPMPHSPLDIYGQLRWLAPSVLGTSFVRFRARYAIMGGFEQHEIKGFQHEAELREKLAQVVYQPSREEIELDLPEISHVRLTTTLEGRARRLYEDLRTDMIAWLEGGVVDLKSALTKVGKLQQVTSGSIKTEDEETGETSWTVCSRAKLDLLAEVIEEIGDEPVVVICRFREDLRRIGEGLDDADISRGELSGSVNDLDDWQGGAYRVLVVQQQAGGLGIDLTRARYCVWYSLGFSLGDYEQTLARVHRPGQTRPVTYYHLTVADTIDQGIYRSLVKRKRDITQVMAGNLAEELLNLIGGGART